MSVDSPPRLTPDDLLSHPDGKNYELVDGELVELNVSLKTAWIAHRVAKLISIFADDRELGWTYPEGGGFQCFADDPTRVRKPDTSFVRRERQPDGPPEFGYGRIAPDLVVEVVSPNDLAWEVDFKVNDWLEAGAACVWVVFPPTRTVHIYRPGRDTHIVTADQDLTEPDLLPGFSCRVSDLFPPGK